jgi:hypothetical protein
MNPLGLNNRLPWRGIQIAWREAHASSPISVRHCRRGPSAWARRPVCAVLAIAFYGMLLRKPGTLMAAVSRCGCSLCRCLADFRHEEKLSSGVRRTWITETLSMVSSGTIANPVLVSSRPSTRVCIRFMAP